MCTRRRSTLAVLLLLVVARSALASAQAHPQARESTTAAARDSLEEFLRGWLRDGGGGNELLDPVVDTLVGKHARETRYAAAPLPLGRPGPSAFVVYLTGWPWCGVNAGCTMLVVARDSAAYRVIGDIPITQLPISVLPSRSHGWPDLGVWAWGGGVHPRRAMIRYDGGCYSGNPSTAPRVPSTGRVILTKATRKTLLDPSTP